MLEFLRSTKGKLCLAFGGLFAALVQATVFTDEFWSTLKAPVSLYNQDAPADDVLSAAGPLGLFVVLLLLSAFYTYLSLTESFEIVDRNRALTSKVAEAEVQRDAAAQRAHLLTTNLDAMFDQQLGSLARKLAFGSKPSNDEWISVYLPSTSEPDSLYLALRLSPNPELKTVTRRRYPKNKGALGKAWTDGRHFQNQLDDWNGGARARKNHKRICRNDYGFSDADLDEMTMHSRLYYGWSVDGLTNEGHAGVVLVEALDPDRWSRAELDAVFFEQREDLRNFIYRLATQRARKDYLSAS